MAASGPSFFAGDDGRAYFTFVIDSGNIIGPRPATDADKAKHAAAWAGYEQAHTEAPKVETPAPKDWTPADMAVPPKDWQTFDHDGDGKPGGSLDKAAIVQALIDKKVQFDARQSRDKLAALLAQAR